MTKDPKIAFCLHGLVGTTDKYGLGKKEIPFKIGHKHYKRHVFDVNDNVDVFIHTWSHHHHDGIKELYQPVAMKSGLPPDFGIEYSKEFVDDNKLARLYAIKCKWQSYRAVIDLVKESGNQYDWVFVTRFDLAFAVDFRFDQFDNSKFYAQGPPGPMQNGFQLINDLWYFSNQENMELFAELQDNMDKPPYNTLESNHELERLHLQTTGLQDKLEYILRRDWTGPMSKLTTETPLVRWVYYNGGDRGY